MSIFKKAYPSYIRTVRPFVQEKEIPSLRNLYAPEINHIIDQSLIKFAAGVTSVSDERLLSSCFAFFKERDPAIDQAVKNVIGVVASAINAMPYPNVLRKLALSTDHIPPDYVVIELLEQVRLASQAAMAWKAKYDMLAATPIPPAPVTAGGQDAPPLPWPDPVPPTPARKPRKPIPPAPLPIGYEPPPVVEKPKRARKVAANKEETQS